MLVVEFLQEIFVAYQFLVLLTKVSLQAAGSIVSVSCTGHSVSIDFLFHYRLLFEVKLALRLPHVRFAPVLLF